MEARALRQLAPGTTYDALFSGVSDRRDRTIGKAGIESTMQLVMKVARKYRFQTEKLAPTLRREKLDETLRAIWDFVYQHIQYRLDEPGHEQVRRPARTWADRVRGVDCEDYAVFISSILLNLGIGHKLRISAYARDWQHIYVVVPKEGVPLTQELALDQSDYHVIDDVTERYDYEVPPTKKRDYTMSLDELSGFGSTDLMPSYPMGTPMFDMSGLGMVSGSSGLVFDQAALSGLGAVPQNLGAPQIIMTYPTASGHEAGIDQYGQLYVEDPSLSGLGFFGKVFKKVKSVADKALTVVNKVPFVKKLADTVGVKVLNAGLATATMGLVTNKTLKGAVGVVNSLVAKPTPAAIAPDSVTADVSVSSPTAELSLAPATAPAQAQAQYAAQQRGVATTTTPTTPPPPGSEDKWYSNPAVLAGGAVVVAGGLYLATRSSAPRTGLSGLPRRKKKTAPKTAAPKKGKKAPSTFRSTPLR